MPVEGTAENNYKRIREISKIHRQEVAKINQYLRIIEDSRTEKTDAMKREHEIWVKKRETEIEAIEAKIAEEKNAFERKKARLIATYQEKEASFQLRKTAAEAYLNVAAEISDQQTTDGFKSRAIASDVEAITVTSELDSLIDKSFDLQELSDLGIDTSENHLTKTVVA